MAGRSENIGGDTELCSEVLRANNKSFFIDLKENARGRYVKVAEKGRYRPKSSIVFPVSGLGPMLQMLRFFLAEAMAARHSQVRDVIIESKVFSFSAGSNDRGQYLRIFESGGGYPSGGSSVMIPAGSGNTYLRTFYEALEKMATHANVPLPPALGSEDDLQLPEGDVGLAATDAAVLDSSKEGGPVLSVGSKHFFFELRNNERGNYLKIKEVCGSMKQLLIVPSHAIQQFQTAIALALHDAPKQDHPTNLTSPSSS